MLELAELNLELGQSSRTRIFRRKRFRPFRHFMQFQWVHPFRSLTSSRFRKDDWDRNPRSVISMDTNTNSGICCQVKLSIQVIPSVCFPSLCSNRRLIKVLSIESNVVVPSSESDERGYTSVFQVYVGVPSPPHCSEPVGFLFCHTWSGATHWWVHSNRALVSLELLTEFMCVSLLLPTKTSKSARASLVAVYIALSLFFFGVWYPRLLRFFAYFCPLICQHRHYQMILLHNLSFERGTFFHWKLHGAEARTHIRSQ